ncbi:MAG: hypothetical protein JSV88_10365 [Candidatus Aminicenantes bacterium]|nr:MAG: hypothetical protein JSV88_10365 [Candidatus Aminicenantes bacterium]
MKKQLKSGFILLTLLALLLSTNSFALEEGGYVGNDVRAIPVVWNFIRHFVWDQYFWAAPFMFTFWNNYFVDNMDFAYYCGHGAPWFIMTYFGGINLATAGSSAHRGYGDRDLEFITFHSCSVIPSPLETPNWWQPWVREPTDIFDGLHQAIGFRTPAWVASAPWISNFYGLLIRWNFNVAMSWFWSINWFGLPGEKGCIVMWPPAVWDRYYWPKCADPPQNHTWLMCLYQI